MQGPAVRPAYIIPVIIFYTWSSFALDEEQVRRFQALVADARRAQDEDQHEKALGLFDEALRIVPDPRVRYFRAVSLQALGREDEALEEFKAIASDPLVAKYRDDIAARIETLERIKVTLTLRTNPPVPATVSIGGKQAGTTPLTLRLKRGEYDITISAPGYRAVSEKLVLKGPEPVEREYNLIRVMTGTLAISCNETGADIFIDGIWQATTPLRSPIQVEVGRRILRVEKLGFATKTLEVLVTENQTTLVSVVLEAEVKLPEVLVKKEARKTKIFGYSGFAVAGTLAATGLGFLVKHGIDVKRMSSGGTKPLDEAFPESSVRVGGDSIRPTNAIVGGICLGAGIVLGVATWLWLWPDE